MTVVRFGVAFALAAGVSLVSLDAQGGRGAGAAQAQPQNVPTPRTADGHPDLSGF